MIPAGYLFKKIEVRPDWIKEDSVRDIYSVSRCISKNFADYIHFWKHNGYWLFDAPEIVEELAKAHEIDLVGLKLFYYEVFENEYDEVDKKWQPFDCEASFVTNVQTPKKKKLEGFDVVTFCARTNPECSPLSCNNLTEEIPVNEHCLLASFEEAKACLDAGKFDNSELGPFRIFAVYSLE